MKTLKLLIVVVVIGLVGALAARVVLAGTSGQFCDLLWENGSTCGVGAAFGNSLSDCDANENTPCDEAIGVYCMGGERAAQVCITWQWEHYCNQTQPFHCGNKSYIRCVSGPNGCEADSSTAQATEDECDVMECQ